MWRRIGQVRCAVGLLLCLPSIPSPAQKHEPKRLERTEILRLEEAWREAQVHDDIAAMDKLLSEEFLGVTASGQVVTKLQQLDRMRTRRLDIRQLEISDAKVKISGNLAVVTSLAHLDGTADGAPLRGDFRYTRVYQRLAGDGWRITNFEATRVGAPPGVSAAVPLAPQAGPGVLPAGVPSSHLTSPGVSVSQRPRS